MNTQFTKKEFDIRSMKITGVRRPLISPIFFGLMLVFVQTNLRAQAEDQQVSPELVGKWCYLELANNTTDAISNSCITLNADGTFDAVLDRKRLPNGNAFGNLQDTDNGKWWVSGNRIFYNSPTNGQGSFGFQKVNHPRRDDMSLIMINGVAFATASSHDPW